jgi:hypothetical protein
MVSVVRCSGRHAKRSRAIAHLSHMSSPSTQKGCMQGRPHYTMRQIAFAADVRKALLYSWNVVSLRIGLGAGESALADC